MTVTTTLSFFQTFIRVAKESFPTIISMIFFSLVNQINIIFVGRSPDPLLLAGVGLGGMLINVFCFATSQGLNGTIESFVSRDFGAGNKMKETGLDDEGALKKYKECGVHLNRARIIIMIVLLPVIVTFFWADTILISLAQDPVISTMARNYVVWSLPGIIALVQFDCRKRWLQSLFFSHVSTQTQVFTTCNHVLVCYILILKLNWGVFGAAMALNFTYGLNFLIQEIYVNVLLKERLSIYEAPLLSIESFKGWMNFLKLGVPGTLMQCFEWWAFEVLAIFAGILGTVQLAAHVAVINVCALVFMIPLGI